MNQDHHQFQSIYPQGYPPAIQRQASSYQQHVATSQQSNYAIDSNLDNAGKSFMHEISIDECNNRQKQEIKLQREYVQQLIETNFPFIVQTDFILNPGMRPQQIPTQMFYRLNANQIISTMNNV
jgi:hypothetical protein